MDIGTVITTAEVTADGGHIYIGFCLDMSYSKPEWVVMAGTSEQKIKEDILEEGGHKELSFVMKVKMPDVTGAKKDETVIKTVEMKEEEKTPAKH